MMFDDIKKVAQKIEYDFRSMDIKVQVTPTDDKPWRADGNMYTVYGETEEDFRNNLRDAQLWYGMTQVDASCNWIHAVITRMANDGDATSDHLELRSFVTEVYDRVKAIRDRSYNKVAGRWPEERLKVGEIVGFHDRGYWYELGEITSISQLTPGSAYHCIVKRDDGKLVPHTLGWLSRRSPAKSDFYVKHWKDYEAGL